ncbi:MAG: hypothetical protein R3B06_19715 [Kofleriaceae bacterium]
MSRRGWTLAGVAAVALVAVVVLRPRGSGRSTPVAAVASPQQHAPGAPTWRPTLPVSAGAPSPDQDLPGVPIPEDERVEIGTAEGYAATLAEAQCACPDRACVDRINQRFGAALGQVVPSTDHATVAAAFARGRACVDRLPLATE